MAELGELDRRVHTVHGLVEQYAVARANLESLEIPLRRNFSQLKEQQSVVSADRERQAAEAAGEEA